MVNNKIMIVFPQLSGVTILTLIHVMNVSSISYALGHA